MRSAKLFLAVVALVVFAGGLTNVPFAQAETVTINPSADVWLTVAHFGGADDYPLYNTGGHIWWVNYREYYYGEYRKFNGLLTFDLSDPTLAGATINSVTLRTTVANVVTNSTVESTIGVYELLKGFTEGDGAWGETATFGEVCAAYQSFDTVAWNTEGAMGVGTDHGSTMLASLTATSSNMVLDQNYDFTSQAAFAGLVQGKLGGSLNLFSQIEDAGGEIRNFRFYSKEGNAALAPRLIIDYTPVPEPSTVALLTAGFLGLLCYAWRKRK